MKVGCSTLQWGMGIDERTRYTWDGKVWDASLDRVVGEISAVGYEGFDCTENDLAPYKTAADFRGMLAVTGIRFISVWTTMLPKKLDPAERPSVDPSLPMSDSRQFASLCLKEITAAGVKQDLTVKKGFARMVSEMGGECLTVGGPFILRKDIKSDHYRLVAEMLGELRETTEGLGLRLAYHPHLSTLLQDSRDVEMFYDHADRRVGLCMDTAHLSAAGEDLPEFIRRYSARLAHVHLKDVLDGSFVELGEGGLDIAGTIRRLDGAGYPYWGGVELDIPQGLPIDSARRSKTYLDQVASGKRK